MRSGGLPSVEAIATALGPIVKTGLPVDSDFADETLLGLPGVGRRSHDPKDRLSRVKALGDLIQELLDRYPDDARKEAAAILFGKAEGNRRQPIGVRRGAAARLLGVQAEHVRTGIQPKIVKMVAWLLHQDSQESAPGHISAMPPHVPDVTESVVPPDGMSFEAHRAARQLYWYAQEAAVHVVSFEVAVRALQDLQRGNCRLTRDATPVRSAASERGLWAFAHCCSHLRELERDDTGREFLVQHFSWSPWAMGLSGGFADEEIVEMQLALSQVTIDEPRPFTEALLVREQGPALEERWLQLVNAPAVQSTRRPMLSSSLPGGAERDGEHRMRLIEALTELLVTFEPMFPNRTQAGPEVWATQRVAVFHLVCARLEPDGDGTMSTQFIEADRAIEVATKRLLAVRKGRKAAPGVRQEGLSTLRFGAESEPGALGGADEPDLA